MKRDSWWGRQLQREDLLTMLEQGRRVEVELFQEKHRGLRTMGELLKARVFGSTQWAIDLRKRMTNYVQGGGQNDGGAQHAAPTQNRSPEPHQFPCEDPYCEPCTEAIKRIFRDLNLLPKSPHPGYDITTEPIPMRLKTPLRYRKDESDK